MVQKQFPEVQSERMEAQILNRSSKTTIKRTMPREVQELVDQGGVERSSIIIQEIQRIDYFFQCLLVFSGRRLLGDGRGSKFLGRAPVIELCRPSAAKPIRPSDGMIRRSQSLIHERVH